MNLQTGESHQYRKLLESLLKGFSEREVLDLRMETVIEKGEICFNGKKGPNPSRGRTCTAQELLSQPAKSAGSNSSQRQHCEFIPIFVVYRIC